MPSMTCCSVCQEEGLSLGTAVQLCRQYSHGRYDFTVCIYSLVSSVKSRKIYKWHQNNPNRSVWFHLYAVRVKVETVKF